MCTCVILLHEVANTPEQKPILINGAYGGSEVVVGGMSFGKVNLYYLLMFAKSYIIYAYCAFFRIAYHHSVS
jgi:hypothetical protein